MDDGFSLGPAQALLATLAIDLTNFQPWKCHNRQLKCPTISWIGAVRKEGKLASIWKCRSVLHGTLRGERKQMNYIIHWCWPQMFSRHPFSIWIYTSKYHKNQKEANYSNLCSESYV
jgi:hypothetical protein